MRARFASSAGTIVAADEIQAGVAGDAPCKAVRIQTLAFPFGRRHQARADAAEYGETPVDVPVDLPATPPPVDPNAAAAAAAEAERKKREREAAIAALNAARRNQF